ncbi:RNA-guided pseudouridylation complex pseudouridine synthase subunit Cbf5 [Candidatus Micrarchaeota archaeon]|nr:MAG: RNA-guided pseudouridylation complex pseudouridine synthase subunit Cbf5 [Candidatus Micrarchaeota archaeon]
MKLESGLILVDKAKGPTSQQLSLWLKDILKKKVCHVGTLDPFASGILPILFGKGIKLQEYMQKHRKEYHFIVEMERPIPRADLESVLKEFEGKIYQKPPKISAVAKRLRTRKIYYLELLELEGRYALLKMGCQHGTYVRKLVDDLSIILGLPMRLLELRRTKVEQFSEKDAVILQKVVDAIKLFNDGFEDAIKGVVKPLSEGVKHLPSVSVKESAIKSITNGMPIAAPAIESMKGDIRKGRPVAVFSGNDLIAMGIALKDREEISALKKGLVVKTDKVLVERKIYK